MKLFPLRLNPYLMIYAYVLLFDGSESAKTKEIPDCDFMDTVNITDGIKLDDGSYIYENITIPPSLIGIYNYDLVLGPKNITVPEHVRGCVCKLKSCVQFCCHPKARLSDLKECTEELNEDLQYSPYINVTLKSGNRQSMHVLEGFVVQRVKPCHGGYILSPELMEGDDWELFENGTLLRLFDNASLSKSEYCLTPWAVNDSYILNPINCPITGEKTNTEQINGIMMLISIPFLVITLIVYLTIPELHNLHGKCLICYLVALSLGYTMFVVIFFDSYGEKYPDQLCISVGFIAYFCFLSAFVWLSVISFDLYYHFNVVKPKMNRSIQLKRFAIYSIFAWGIPLLMTALTYFAQISNLDDVLKPNIGVKFCWLNIKLWSPMFYFFGPILLLMIFNLTMFILIAWKIYKVKADMKRFEARKESTKHLRRQKNNFVIYLRLFIVMGVTWLLEVFSYMVNMDKIGSYLFLIPDICNAAQGIIIFILFVLKKKVRILIKKRFVGDKRKQRAFGLTKSISTTSTPPVVKMNSSTAFS